MFKAYASGSSGNFYECDDGTTRLGLDCGLTYKKLQKACKNTLGGIQAFLITHEHGDHAKGVRSLMERGVDIYTSRGTAEALELDMEDPQVHIVEPLKQFEVGSYKIKGFKTIHDAAEPLGYLIKSTVTGEKLVWFTDTAAINHRFDKCAEIAVECNYSEMDLMADKQLPMRVLHRIRHSHMSVEDLERYLMMWDLSETKLIHLIHLSTRHAYAEEFIKRIQTATGIETRAAGRNGYDGT